MGHHNQYLRRILSLVVWVAATAVFAAAVIDPPDNTYRCVGIVYAALIVLLGRWAVRGLL